MFTLHSHMPCQPNDKLRHGTTWYFKFKFNTTYTSPGPLLARSEQHRCPSRPGFWISGWLTFLSYSHPQLRLDFNSFNLAPPTVNPYPACHIDTLSIANLDFNLCGENSGQHSKLLDPPRARETKLDLRLNESHPPHVCSFLQFMCHFLLRWRTWHWPLTSIWDRGFRDRSDPTGTCECSNWSVRWVQRSHQKPPSERNRWSRPSTTIWESWLRRAVFSITPLRPVSLNPSTSTTVDRTSVTWTMPSASDGPVPIRHWSCSPMCLTSLPETPLDMIARVTRTSKLPDGRKTTYLYRKVLLRWNRTYGRIDSAVRAFTRDQWKVSNDAGLNQWIVKLIDVFFACRYFTRTLCSVLQQRFHLRRQWSNRNRISNVLPNSLMVRLREQPTLGKGSKFQIFVLLFLWNHLKSKRRIYWIITHFLQAESDMN